MRCRWVPDLYPGRRTPVFELLLAEVGFDMEAATKSVGVGAAYLKRLINELLRCGAHGPVEQNLDISTAISGRKRF